MEVIKKYKEQIKFHLILNFAVGIFITFSSYFHIPLNYISDYSIYFIHFLILQFTIYGFIYFLSINKYLFYLSFPLLFIIYSMFSYWIYTLDISISGSIIQAVMESNIDIAIDLITIPFLIYVVFIFFTIYFILNEYKKLQINQLKSPLTILAFLAIMIFYIMGEKGIGNLKWRMPYNLAFSFIEYNKKPFIKLLPINESVEKNVEDINIIFVLGESVRAKNLGLNGYYRNTTPLLDSKENLISFSNVFTPLTYTAVSIPQILTNESVKPKKNNYGRYSIYTILNKIKIKTSWIGNQTPEKSYSIFINENDSINLIDKFRGVFSFRKKLDGELLPYFKSIFKNPKSQFITLQMIGSHWWYENRYSEEFRKFTPVIDSKHVPSLTKEQLINSYDNTIIYLDHFLNETITIIEKSSSKTILIYLADHGEILGENGKWLHAQNDESSTNPAMIVWFSNEFEKAYPNKIKNLKNNASKKITTDFFFHSILDLIDIQNFEYQKSNSIFN